MVTVPVMVSLLRALTRCGTFPADRCLESDTVSLDWRLAIIRAGTVVSLLLQRPVIWAPLEMAATIRVGTVVRTVPHDEFIVAADDMAAGHLD